MWPFQARPTSIEAKAELAGKAFWKVSGEYAATVLHVVHPTDYADRNMGVLMPTFAEVIAFAMHVTSRIALSRLGEAHRAAFMDAWFPVVLRLCPKEIEGQLQQLYNRREVQYGACKKPFAAEGEPLKGTLLWEFARVVIDDDIVVILAVIDAGTQMIGSLQSQYDKARVFD